MELERKSNLAEKLNRDLQDNFEELQSFYETLHNTNKHAEDTLREMRDLYENAPTGYHSLDSSGLIVRMNQTELNWLGYTREEIVGKRSRELNPSTTDARAAMIVAHLNEHGSYRFESEHRLGPRTSQHSAV